MDYGWTRRSFRGFWTTDGQVTLSAGGAELSGVERHSRIRYWTDCLNVLMRAVLSSLNHPTFRVARLRGVLVLSVGGWRFDWAGLGGSNVCFSWPKQIRPCTVLNSEEFRQGFFRDRISVAWGFIWEGQRALPVDCFTGGWYWCGTLRIAHWSC